MPCLSMMRLDRERPCWQRPSSGKTQNASHNISCPSNCSRSDAAIGDLRQRGAAPVAVTMAVITGMVFGGTVGLVAGGVTVAGRAMAVGNGFPMARFVGFAAENRGEVLQLGPLNAAR
jgi:hypothetical protein